MSKCFWKNRGFAASVRSASRFAHVVGGSKVGQLEGFINELLSGDRRCRFSVYRRASFQSIINMTRRQIRTHNPKTTERLIILYTDIRDVLSVRSHSDLNQLWHHTESLLNGLAADCRLKQIKLIVCSFTSDALEPRFNQACDYFNSALRSKFCGTQVVVRDLSQIQSSMNENRFRNPVRIWDDTSSDAKRIADDVAKFLGIYPPALKQSASSPLIPSRVQLSRARPPTAYLATRQKSFFQHPPHSTFPPSFPQPRSTITLQSVAHLAPRYPVKACRKHPQRPQPPSKLSGEQRHILYLTEY